MNYKKGQTLKCLKGYYSIKAGDKVVIDNKVSGKFYYNVSTKDYNRKLSEDVLERNFVVVPSKGKQITKDNLQNQISLVALKSTSYFNSGDRVLIECIDNVEERVKVLKKGYVIWLTFKNLFKNYELEKEEDFKYNLADCFEIVEEKEKEKI